MLTIYSDKQLNRDIFGWEMPVSWVQSINPVFIIMLSGVFAALWTKLGDRQPSTPVKFALGTDRSWASRSCCSCRSPTAAPNSTPLLAIVGILFVFTVAELLLSPVGLSVTTKLAPEALPHADGGAVLPVGRARHGDRRLARRASTRSTNEVPYFAILGGIAIVLGAALLVGRKPVLR